MECSNNLKLKEIVYEITKNCKNNCWYCGSKKRIHDNILNNVTNINEIIKKIVEYPPEAITISGGDPLIISKEIHEHIIKMLHTKNIECKIIINPKSNLNENSYIFDLYDKIGISINTYDDSILYLDHVKKINIQNKKIVIVSNFNVKNLFHFNAIKNFIKNNQFSWQIQYTVFENEDDELAIYNDDYAFDFFAYKIEKCIEENMNLLLSDNLNANNCFAGKNVIGITADGNVLPCLSMLSWTEEENVYEGNLLKENLKDIWENKFKKYRFDSYKCCKDHCNNKAIIKYVEKNNFNSEKDDLKLEINIFDEQVKKLRREPIIGYYMLQDIPNWPNFIEPIITAYATGSNRFKTTTNNITYTFKNQKNNENK